MKGGNKMPKTAQQWMQDLELDELPDAEFLEALNALEGKETVGRASDPVQGAGLTPDDLAAAVNAGSVGEALKRLRQQAALTTRDAGELLGTSHARVTQLERPDATPNLTTVARTAYRLGYHTKLVFEPIEDGPTITAPLTGA